MLSVASWLCRKCGKLNEVSVKNIIDAISTDEEDNSVYLSPRLILYACNCKGCNERHVVIMKVNVNINEKNREVSIDGEIVLIVTKDSYKKIEELMKS